MFTRYNNPPAVLDSAHVAEVCILKSENCFTSCELKETVPNSLASTAGEMQLLLLSYINPRKLYSQLFCNQIFIENLL